MAGSTCVKCGNKTFEVAHIQPEKSRLLVLVVQCAKCGGVIGLADYLNVDAERAAYRKEFKKLAKSVGVKVSDLGMD